jgi:acetyl esterase/lipase
MMSLKTKFVLYLVLSSLLFLVSLLAVFQAPTNLLWKLAVAVTEFPHLFIIASLLCLIGYRGTGNQALVSYSINVIAFLLFCSPILRSLPFDTSLPGELNKAFAGKKEERAPFSLIRMIRGNSFPEIRFRSMEYKRDSAGKALSLDFYPARQDSGKACIVVIHGGSWSSGDSQQLPALNSYLAGKGYPVASINYRLAATAIFPAPVDDLKAALRYLKAHAAELGIDPGNFVLLGRSAGGQIALLAAYTLKDPALKGVIAYYAPADMVWGYTLPANPLIMDSRKVMEDYLGGTFEKAKANFFASSPIEFAGPDAPPTLLIHGERDELVAWEHSRRLDAKLNTLGVPHYLLTLPWATHGCDYNLSGPSGQLSTYSIDYFLQSIRKN